MGYFSSNKYSDMLTDMNDSVQRGNFMFIRGGWQRELADAAYLNKVRWDGIQYKQLSKTI